jgi:HK97 family phage major capsid protein
MLTDTEIKDLRTKARELLETNERMPIKVEGENVDLGSNDDVKTYRANLGKVREIQALIQEHEQAGELKAWLDETPESKAAAAAAQAALRAPGAAVYRDMPKSLGEMFTDSDEFKAMVRSGGATMTAPWEVKGTDLGRLVFGASQKDVYAGMSGALHDISHGFGRIQFDPMVPRNFRRARVRDLFPVAQTSANLIDFFRVLGFGTDRLDLTSNASVVADRVAGAFGLKPHSELKFEVDQAPVRTIAHLEYAHRNVLQDEPQLQSTINNELLYGLRLTEDNQILNGTGAGEDLRGILNTDGIQEYDIADGPATDKKQDALRRSATLAILAYYDPTGIVVHPFDWEDIELDKGEDGHYTVSMNVTVGADARLWRMSVVDSPAIAQGTGLVGAFGTGAQLYDRMQANIRIAEQHSDLFARNAVAILAEERLALAVKRPESFVKVDLGSH